MVELAEQTPLAGSPARRRAGAGRDPARAGGEDPDRPVPHLAAAGPHRRAGDRLGGPGRRAAEDGHLRLRADRDADAARGVAGLGVGDRRGRHRLGRSTAPWWRSPRPTSSGWSPTPRSTTWATSSSRSAPPGCVADDTAQARWRRGHRRRHPDGQPRADHRGAVPARRGAAGPGRRATTWTPTAGSPAPAPRFATLFAVGRVRLARAARRSPASSRSSRSSPAASPPPRSPPSRCSGILLTAALFLRALQRVFTGETRGLVGRLRRPAPRRGLVGRRRCWPSRC